jgi:hypothetical protein
MRISRASLMPTTLAALLLAACSDEGDDVLANAAGAGTSWPTSRATRPPPTRALPT